MTASSLLGASKVRLPREPYTLLIDFLSARFPAVGYQIWQQRMLEGKVLDIEQRCLRPDEPYQAGALVYYFREVPDEAQVPFKEQILHQDEHLLAVDKPHFLPTLPTGRYVEETVLRRLMRRFNNPDIAPIHRLDRLTAGVLLFSLKPSSRDAYQRLFREGKVFKCYEALAPALPHQQWPYRHRSRLESAEQFFRMQEVAGQANSDTVIEVQEQHGALWRYRLYPVTGRKHQLRVHLAALGAPIVNDPWYPQLRHIAAQDLYQQPLKLLAKQISFVDPYSGVLRSFKSQMTLTL
ncbi:MAG TPA: pseudouridine synthase [Thiopseudomonas sp.]|nr:pseudouridine synthase [Thiopseudomonas sp.]